VPPAEVAVPGAGFDVSPAGFDAPFAGFDVQVLTDRVAYAPGESVRITVTAANQGDRWVEHHYPGWQRYLLTIRDERHRIVADDEVDRLAGIPAVDRWIPGQIAIWPTYWSQNEGPIVPARHRDPPGQRVPPGRYRVWVEWLGREPGVRARPAEAIGPWFEVV
jgi:hypothetical protein